jgi:hypothetical protein
MKKMLVVTLLIPLLFGCVKEGVEEAEEIAEEIIETTEETVEVIEEEVVQEEPENIIEESSEEYPSLGDIVLENDVDTSNWQTYRSEEYGFEISYPQGWVYEKYDNRIYFGTPKSKSGGYMWRVSIEQPSKLEDSITQMGRQFNDRKESRAKVRVNSDIIGMMATVTTNEYNNWISKVIYFEDNGKLFEIGNGALDDDRFSGFYRSFQFAD